MARQLSVLDYVNSFQGALQNLYSPTPVYVNYSQAKAIESEFIVWTIRNVHQEIYTGSQDNKGLDRPIFQLNIFATRFGRVTQLADIAIQAWHGYIGNLNGIAVGKADVDFLLSTYDEEASLHQAVLDITMHVEIPNL